MKIKETVSVIICTHRSARTIGAVIDSIMFHNPFEVIVVDACSSDGTAMIAKRSGATVVYDNGSGLGNARNLGLSKARGNYILYIGPDNILPKSANLLHRLIKAMEFFKFDGLGVRSKVFAPCSYFDHGMDLRWNKKITAGEKSTIGTPFMFKRSVLNKYKFNPNNRMSDDTELCNRMTASGRRVGYSNIQCFEISSNRPKDIIARFKAYGRSDGEYYLQYKRHWHWNRRIKSLLHPFSEFSIIKELQDIKYIPFVVFVVVCRYIGYIGELNDKAGK